MNMNDHLKSNRGLILSRALLAGAAGMLPVPYIDDLLAGAVRSALIRRLGEIRSVDLDANAIEELAHPRGSRLLSAASMGAIALSGTKRVFRKVAASILIVRRVDEAVQTFQIGTLFDHYCAKHHVGLGIDHKRAILVRYSMDQASRKSRSETLERAFKTALRASSEVAMKLPRGALSLWARRRGGPVPAEKVAGVLEERLDAAAETGFVRRAVQGVEAELTSDGGGWIGGLIGAFDEALKAATALVPPDSTA
jgi:uncharacterized protein (DUF697 family)